MGYSTLTDVVPFVAHNVFEGDMDSMVNPISDRMMHIIEPDDYTDGTIDLTINGWKLDYGQSGFHMIGKRSRLYAHKWIEVDGEKIVYTINESVHSSVGIYELAVIADNEDAITAFCIDNELVIRFGIDETEAVQQTL